MKRLIIASVLLLSACVPQIKDEQGNDVIYFRSTFPPDGNRMTRDWTAVMAIEAMQWCNQLYQIPGMDNVYGFCMETYRRAATGGVLELQRQGKGE